MRFLLCTLLFTVPVATVAAQSASRRAPQTARTRPAAAGTAPAATIASAPASPAPCGALTGRQLQPYTVHEQTTRKQTLANGTIITETSTTVQARDSAGRTLYQTTRSTPDNSIITTNMVYDPANHKRMSWSTGTQVTAKVVSVYPLSQITQAIAPPTQPAARRYYPTKTESLPPDTILGLYVEGSRMTRTIPAGYEGNDRDLNTVTETWTSPGLVGPTLHLCIDDPRSGRTETIATSFERTADPALFQPPAGYELRDVPLRTP